MNVKTSAEKEWIRKLTTGKDADKKEQKAPQRAVVHAEVKKPDPKYSNGFGDVAGMDELKQMVTEGFINVLNNQECAKAFGITPPYIILPVDILNAKRLPIIGWFDEIASLSVTYQKVRDNITPEIEAKADALLDKWFPEYTEFEDVPT